MALVFHVDRTGMPFRRRRGAAYYPAEPFAAMAAAISNTPALEQNEEPEEEMTVYIDCASGFYELAMTQGNVSDALSSLSLEYDDDDRVTPELHVLLEDSLRIEAVSRETRTRTETKTIKHKTEKRKTIPWKKAKPNQAKKAKTAARP